VCEAAVLPSMQVMKVREAACQRYLGYLAAAAAAAAVTPAISLSTIGPSSFCRAPAVLELPADQL